MTDADAYAEWLDQFSYLSLEETFALPAWQQPIALIQQLAMAHLNDGAASLFYNDPVKIQPIVSSLKAIDEIQLAELVLRISDVLSHVVHENALNRHAILVDQLIYGPAARLAQELDALIEMRWDEFHAKLEKLAKTNGCPPDEVFRHS